MLKQPQTSYPHDRYNKFPIATTMLNILIITLSGCYTNNSWVLATDTARLVWRVALTCQYEPSSWQLHCHYSLCNAGAGEIVGPWPCISLQQLPRDTSMAINHPGWLTDLSTQTTKLVCSAGKTHQAYQLLPIIFGCKVSYIEHETTSTKIYNVVCFTKYNLFQVTVLILK